MNERFVQLKFSAAFDSVSRSGLLYKLRLIGVVGKLLLIVSEFFSDRRQRVRLDGKVSVIRIAQYGSQQYGRPRRCTI